MEQMTADEIQEYETLKYELKATLDETADNFITIGYILKQVRDRRLYLHENYRDIYGFGMGAYGLSRATVSRFMNINTKFSIGGNSREMKPEYKGYGRSKIQEMLNVDEGDMALITADTTVEQVKELKKAEEEQRQLERAEQESRLPLVQMTAEQDETGRKAEAEPVNPFEAVLTAFWKENTDLYRRVAAGMLTPEILAEEISPSGSRTFRNGVNMMFFYDRDKGLKLRSYAKGRADITAYTYQELIDKTKSLNITEESENLCCDAAAAIEKTETDSSEESASPYLNEQPVYKLLPGQTSVADLPDVLPDTNKDAVKSKNVIDGDYRELSGKKVQEDKDAECRYSDIEIKNAVSYFDMESSRMAWLGKETVKSRNYRIALECIRKCYPSIAGQTDHGLRSVENEENNCKRFNE